MTHHDDKKLPLLLPTILESLMVIVVQFKVARRYRHLGESHFTILYDGISVTSKKLPNVCKSCQK